MIAKARNPALYEIVLSEIRLRYFLPKMPRENEPRPLPDQGQNDPEKGHELDRLNARLDRLNRQAALLAAGMQQKPKK